MGYLVSMHRHHMRLGVFFVTCSRKVLIGDNTAYQIGWLDPLDEESEILRMKSLNFYNQILNIKKDKPVPNRNK